MNFTDAVTVPGTPPVEAGFLSACKRKLAEFAKAESIPMPITATWFEFEGKVVFTSTHEGRTFAIGAPIAN